MKTRTYLTYSMALTLAGTLFSGYTSTVRLSSGTCAFAEPCPMFLGYPACYTGFALFATMLVVSAFARVWSTTGVWPLVVNAIVSAAGVLFATSLTVGDLFALAGGARYRLGLPTCAYGLVFFAAVLILSIAALVRRPHAPKPPFRNAPLSARTP